MQLFNASYVYICSLVSPRHNRLWALFAQTASQPHFMNNEWPGRNRTKKKKRAVFYHNIMQEDYYCVVTFVWLTFSWGTAKIQTGQHTSALTPFQFLMYQRKPLRSLAYELPRLPNDLHQYMSLMQIASLTVPGEKINSTLLELFELMLKSQIYHHKILRFAPEFYWTELGVKESPFYRDKFHICILKNEETGANW